MAVSSFFSSARTREISPRPRQPGRLAAFSAQVSRMVQLIQSRRALSLADERILKDMGISRAQAEFEGSRPWWDSAPPRI